MALLKKKGSSAPSGRDAALPASNSNPYATNAPADDPYVNSGASTPAPPPYSSGPASNERFRSDKSGGGYGGGPPDRYGAGQPAGGYGGGPDRYGGSGGGVDRYGGGGEQRDRFAAGRPDPFAGARQDGPPQTLTPGGAQQDRFRGPQPAAMQNRGGPPAPAPAPTNRFGAPPGPAPANRFGAPPAAAPPAGDRFGAGTYGNQGGFGQDRYGGGPPQPAAESRYGSGGYGNFGGNASVLCLCALVMLIDHRPNSAARDQLFAGARPMDQPPPGMPPTGTSDWESGRGENYGSGNYESYDQRQLTAEEQEEEDITGTKQEIRFLKQQDVSSTRNALRLAAQAEETGRSTLERIGAQGESIHNTERNLDLASNQNKLAAEKVRTPC
jgi:hypothetical protein